MIEQRTRNALAIEVSEEVDVVEVLQKQGTIYACSLGSIGLVYGSTIGGGVDCAVFVVPDVGGGHRCLLFMLGEIAKGILLYK